MTIQLIYRREGNMRTSYTYIYWLFSFHIQNAQQNMYREDCLSSYSLSGRKLNIFPGRQKL